MNKRLHYCVYKNLFEKLFSVERILSANLSYFNFHQPEVVSRYRDPQLQVCENYFSLILFFTHLIWNQTFANFNHIVVLSA